MKRLVSLLLLVTFLALAMSSCGPSPPPASTPQEEIELLQEGNDLPKTILQTRKSTELEDNNIGQHWYMRLRENYTEYGIIRTIGNISNLGLKWVRLSIDHFDANKLDWYEGGYSKYEIDPVYDKAVTLLDDREIKIIYCLVYWDETLHVGEGYPRYQKEEEIQRYLDYTRFIVNHFKDRIDYYEILNEPLHPEPQQHVELADYINLIQRVIPVIREEHPEAKVVVGASPIVHEYQRDYFFGILNSNILPMVDAISFHPIYGTSPAYDTHKEYYYSYPSILQEMKDTAFAHGFEGEYIAEEINWRTSRTAFVDAPWTYSEITSAKYYARGIIMHLGMNIHAGLILHNVNANVPEVRVVKNLCTVMAGAEPTDLLVEIESDAENIRSYTFSLTNGDILIALWTDGVAVDDDPGVQTTLTLPDLSAQKVVGIDVLNGFEQEIITNVEDGNLVIENLLVKDYPIILRLTP